MSPARSRSVHPSPWLVAAVLVLGASGCATLFGMQDASCSDCTSTQLEPNQPAPDATPPAAAGANAAERGPMPAVPESGITPAGLAPSPTPPSVRSPAPVDSSRPDAGPDSGSKPEDPCTTYCAAVTNTCKPSLGVLPDNRAYVDQDACLKLCPYFPRAAAGDPPGKNTLECRLELLESGEADEPSAVCQAAGRTGQAGANPVCGSNCDAYCSLMQQLCPMQFSALLPSCESVCAGLGDELAFDLTRDELSGNTVQCRLWHLGLAATCDPLKVPTCLPLHCGHAAGASPCNPPAP